MTSRGEISFLWNPLFPCQEFRCKWTHFGSAKTNEGKLALKYHRMSFQSWTNWDQRDNNYKSSSQGLFTVILRPHYKSLIGKTFGGFKPSQTLSTFPLLTGCCCMSVPNLVLVSANIGSLGTRRRAREAKESFVLSINLIKLLALLFEPSSSDPAASPAVKTITNEKPLLAKGRVEKKINRRVAALSFSKDALDLWDVWPGKPIWLRLTSKEEVECISWTYRVVCNEKATQTVLSLEFLPWVDSTPQSALNLHRKSWSGCGCQQQRSAGQEMLMDNCSSKIPT